MLDHEDHLDCDRLTTMYLLIERFKRKTGVSDEDWFDSLPSAITELRKGLRDMLRSVLDAVEHLDRYNYGEQSQARRSRATIPASATLRAAIEDCIAEHSRKWPKKTTQQVQAYLNILLEHFGAERPLAAISKADASEVKKVLQSLPASRNTKAVLQQLPLSEVIKVWGTRPSHCSEPENSSVRRSKVRSQSTTRLRPLAYAPQPVELGSLRSSFLGLI